MDGEMGAQIYGAASDRDQASLVFNVAAKMVRLNPALSKRLKVVDSRKTITDEKTGSFYRAIPADAAGAHGFNAHGIIFDELHAQKSRELWDVLTTSMGTRKQPLVFAITTAGFDRESICWEQHEYTRKVQDGILEDPSRYGRIWAVPKELDWQDESNWGLANPALGDFRDIGEMRDLCRQAKHVPAFENTFRNLYLSQWTQSASRYIPMHEWEHGADPLDPSELQIGRAHV
jgi:phage terminase large subunit-like protein